MKHLLSIMKTIPLALQKQNVLLIDIKHILETKSKRFEKDTTNMICSSQFTIFWYLDQVIMQAITNMLYYSIFKLKETAHDLTSHQY